MSKFYSGKRNFFFRCVSLHGSYQTVKRHSKITSSFPGFFALVTMVLLASFESKGQNATATWPLTANATATLTGNLGTAGVSTGASSVGYNSTTGFGAKGMTTSSQTAAQTKNDYVEFTLTPAAGYSFTVSSILTTNSVSAVATNNAARFQLMYSTSANPTLVNLGATVTPTTSITPTSFGNLAIPVAAGQTLYIRIYVWNLSGTSTEFRTKDFTIAGMTCPTTAAISYPKAAYCKDPNTTISPTRTGAAGGSFTSTPGLVINSTTGAIDVTNSTAGTYTVSYTVSSANCTNLVATTTIKINDLPTAFTLTGPDGAMAEFCTNGTPATFTLSGSQTGVSYTFVATNPGGNNPPGQSIQVPGVDGSLQFTQTPDGKWSYSVNAKDDATGCTNTMIGELKAVNGPTITSQPPAQVSACLGGAPTALTVNVSNANALSWQVSTDGGNSWSTITDNTNYKITKAPNNSTTTLTISNYTAAMNGYRYRVVYGGPAACPINYSTGTVLTVSAPPVIIVPPVSKSVCPNSTLVLSVMASNASSYEWYKNGVLVATTAQYSKTFDAATDAGNYTVKVTGPCGSVTSSPVSVTVNNSTTTTWQGPMPGLVAPTGTAWEVESNWSCGVPTSTKDAVIPADIMDGYPTIKPAVTGEVRNLEINGGGFGAFVTVQGKLRVFGSLVNRGGLFDATAGTIEFSGSTDQTIPAGFFFDNTVQNLIISNNVSLAGNLKLKGALSFGNVDKKTFSTADYLTLKSDAAATARVADITNNKMNSGNTITGNVTVERYMPNYRRYRLVTSPVRGATINTAWQEGRTWNGVGTEPSQFGTLITGASQGTAANANNNGFDFWTASSGASVFKYSGSLTISNNLGATWTAVTNTRLNGFDNHEAYLLYVRGDRTVTTAASATVLRGKGPLKEAESYTIPLSKQSHVLIGNPFAGPLDFGSVYNDNSSVIEPYYWTWQASLGTGTGGYVLMIPNGGSGYEAIPYGGATSGTEAVISSGEGFFVVPKASAVLPNTITIEQKHKTSAAPMMQTFRAAQNLRQTGSAAPRLRANVFAEANSETVLLDGALARYSESGGETEVVKAVNSSENLAFVKGGKYLILASNALPKGGDTLQLRLWNLGVRDYRLQIGCSQFGTTALSPVLVDQFRKTETPFSLAEGINYAFSVTADAASKDPLRFSIVFKAGRTLPLVLSSATATQKGQGVAVDWQVPDETGVQGYVVEKSADGTSFQVLSETKASGSAGPAAYTVLDEAPSSTGYYRIRLTGTNGETKYSQVLKVQLQKAGEGITVYPNPVTGGVVHLQLVNKPKASYVVSLVNAGGQTVWQQSLQHPGGSAASPLAIGRNLAAGVYTLQVKTADGRGETLRLQVVR